MFFLLFSESTRDIPLVVEEIKIDVLPSFYEPTLDIPLVVEEIKDRDIPMP